VEGRFTGPVRPPLTLWLLVGTALLLASLAAAVAVGAVGLTPGTVLGIAVDRFLPGLLEVSWSKGQAAIVWEIRMPRALLACLVGAGLATVGACLQSVTRNPLADPHLLGVSSGGAFGAVLALLHTGSFIGFLTVPLLAFAGAMVAMALVLLASRFTGSSGADRLVLTGVAVSFLLMACANVLIFLGDPRATHSVVFWMLGGLGLAQWGQLPYPAAVLAVCLVWLWRHGQSFNAMTLGDETATTLGISVVRFRLLVFAVAALVTGVMVAFSGIIGFVGLMVPHMLRLLVGGDYRRLLPLCALAGAIFVLWADIVARTIMAPEDMPIGIVTGLVGGLFFLWLLRRKR